MSTADTLRAYFRTLNEKGDWSSLLSENVAFTSFTSPVRQVTGRAAYVEATRRFYSMIAGMTLRGLLVDGDRACALTRYQLQPPGRAAVESDVAEVFVVRNGRIVAFDIYFDSAPFPGQPQKGDSHGS